MNYTSRITSKGTITLPAPLRKQLGLQEGDTVELSLKSNTIAVKPRNSWDEFFANTNSFGKKARDMIAKGEKSALLTSEDIAKAAQEGRARGY